MIAWSVDLSLDLAFLVAAARCALWVRDLKTGRERQLTALGRGFTIGDFDISPDGRERYSIGPGTNRILSSSNDRSDPEH